MITFLQVNIKDSYFYNEATLPNKVMLLFLFTLNFQLLYVVSRDSIEAGSNCGS